MGKKHAVSIGPIEREGKVRSQPKVKADEVPTGTIDEIMQWVAGDKRRAAAALAAEKKGENRSSLISSLERLTAEPPQAGAGVESGQA